MRNLVITLGLLVAVQSFAFAELMPLSDFDVMSRYEEMATKDFINTVDNYDAKKEKQQKKVIKLQKKIEKQKSDFDRKIQAKQKEQEDFINVHQIRLEQKRQKLQELIEEN